MLNGCLYLENYSMTEQKYCTKTYSALMACKGFIVLISSDIEVASHFLNFQVWAKNVITIVRSLVSDP